MKRNELIKARGDETQTKVANDLGITQKHLSKIELGERNPSIELLAKLCAKYSMNPSDLFPDIFLQNSTPKSCTSTITVI